MSQAVVRICTANTATATTAELAVADVSIPETVKQGIKDVSLVGGLPNRIESLDDVVAVVSYRRIRNERSATVPLKHVMKARMSSGGRCASQPRFRWGKVAHSPRLSRDWPQYTPPCLQLLARTATFAPATMAATMLVSFMVETLRIEYFVDNGGNEDPYGLEDSFV